MTSSASATEGRFNRYPLTPTYQYNNSPMILSPHSPASPSIQYHGNQAQIQTPHSMLRHPPLNYNSPQPMSGISSNSGTPTNANGTSINMAVTTAAAMPMNNGYAIKDESNQYFAQNTNGNSNTQKNQNQNGEMNNYYDNSQSSSSLYVNQQPTSQSTNINNQQNFIPQTQAPQTSQQQSSDQYINPNSNGQPAQNNNNGYGQTNQSSYQATTIAQTPSQDPQTQQKYISQPYTQQNQYTVQNTTQNYNQNQQNTPQQTYITQPSQSQAYLTPPQATTQQTPSQPNNYMSNVSNQTQGKYMNSPQSKLPSLEKNGKTICEKSEEYLNSPSSNKNDIINPTKVPAESKDPKKLVSTK